MVKSNGYSKYVENRCKLNEINFKRRKVMSPCQDCQDRQVGCHSSCGKYIEYSNELKELNKEKTRIHNSYDFLKQSIT